MPRALAPLSRYVCDFTHIWRARLLAGFYYRLSGPNWHQYIARLYCILFPILFFASHFYVNESLVDNYDFWLWFGRFRCMQYYINVIASLWTVDTSVFRFCALNNFTDITLDSASIFFKFEKKFKRIVIMMFLVEFTNECLYYIIWPEEFYTVIYLQEVIWEFICNFNFVTKFLVLGVLRSRLEVLRAKLARHGFRRARDCALGTNIYCQMYTEILESFHNIENHLKFLITIDFIFDSLCCICMSCGTLRTGTNSLMGYVFVICMTCEIITPMYLLCFEMESAVKQVEAIREMAVMELIKNPSVRERRAILELLALTEAAPAQLPLCRALRVDARLLLAMLGFCSGRVLLILQTFPHK